MPDAGNQPNSDTTKNAINWQLALLIGFVGVGLGAAIGAGTGMWWMMGVLGGIFGGLGPVIARRAN